jgi:ribose/xylose/arabinose/galactoside ABC-type transport system permease subunit
MRLEAFRTTRFQFRRDRLIGDSQVRADEVHVAALELLAQDGTSGLGFAQSLFAPLPDQDEIERVFEAEVWPGLAGQEPLALVHRVNLPRGGNRRGSTLPFAEAVQVALWDLAAKQAGMLLGAFVGILVVYCSLSSLIAKLGMNFMLRGIIQIVMEGKSIALMSLTDSSARAVFSGTFFGIPVQMAWAVAFVIFAIFLFNRHRFGAQVKVVGDNPDSAGQMGIDVRRVRVMTFVFVGFGAACAGFFSTMINFTWWPTSGDGYLLPALASVFVGGTPTWGGIGTVAGGAIGAVIVSFIQTGVVGAGLSGFYVQFFNGLIIILSLIGHRWNQSRYR